MTKAAILLGAGASIDAGLPSAYDLTRRVYTELCKPSYGKESVLFAYIVSKLISRRVLAGGSPFDPINIEEAYDAILRLLDRDKDPLADFVYSWDPILEHMRPEFDEQKFMRGIVESLHDQSRALSRGHIVIDQSGLRKSAEAISAVIGSSRSGASSSRTAGIYIDILVSILSKPDGDVQYVDEMVKFSSENDVTVATLNYDLLFEQAAKRLEVNWDYGLNNWQNNRLVLWPKGAKKLFKLHGSINWSGANDTISVNADAPEVGRWSRSNAVLIFGGQSVKLTPHGPFLQLRHDFEREIMRRERLLVVGYSFGDQHINSMLRRWVSTRKSGKLVIIEPGRVEFGLDVFRDSFVTEGTGSKKKIDIVHVRKTAASGMKQALNQLKSKIDLTHDKGKSGYLPHIMVNVIT